MLVKMTRLTGTFFCDRTTAQSFPRTPIAMMFAAVIALNAYSVAQKAPVSAISLHPLCFFLSPFRNVRPRLRVLDRWQQMRTDLIQPSLFGEDRDMSVVCRVTYCEKTIMSVISSTRASTRVQTCWSLRSELEAQTTYPTSWLALDPRRVSNLRRRLI